MARSRWFGILSFVGWWLAFSHVDDAGGLHADREDSVAWLIIDKDRYAQNKDVTHLVCLVFDHDGLINNPRGIEQDLSNFDPDTGVTCTVRILDR